MLACYFEHRSQTKVVQHQQHGSRFYRNSHLCTSVHRRSCITCFCPPCSLSLSVNVKIHLAHSTSSGIYRAHTVTSSWFWWHSSVRVLGFSHLFCEYAARCVTFIGQQVLSLLDLTILIIHAEFQSIVNVEAKSKTEYRHLWERA